MTDRTPIIDIATHLSSAIGEHLSTWLKQNKSVDVTAEELVKALNLPYTVKSAGLPPSAGVQVQMPALPGFTATAGATPKKRGGGRGKKSTAPPDPNAPKCIYAYQRGDKRGNVCGAACANDAAISGSGQYCAACLKKKTVQNKLTNGSSGKNTVKPPSHPGGMVAVPPQAAEKDGPSLDAQPFGNPDEGLFRVNDTGFIVKPLASGQIVVLGRADSETGPMRDLTAAEKIQAQQIGLAVPEEDEGGDGDGDGEDEGDEDASPAPVKVGAGLPPVPSVPAGMPQLPKVPISRGNK